MGQESQFRGRIKDRREELPRKTLTRKEGEKKPPLDGRKVSLNTNQDRTVFATPLEIGKKDGGLKRRKLKDSKGGGIKTCEERRKRSKEQVNQKRACKKKPGR